MKIAIMAKNTVSCCCWQQKDLPQTEDAFCTDSHPEFSYGRRSRLILQTTKNRKFPLGNSLLYISLSSVALIASFTSRANLNNLFAICNSRLLPMNQIVNCDGRVRPGGRALFFTMLHHFLRAASGIRHQHGSGSDAAHPGIVPIFCAGMPCKLARKQCHFPAYCPILSA